LETRNGSRAGHRMPGIGVAVHDGPREVLVAGKSGLDPLIDRGATQRDVARRDPFREAHDVRLHFPSTAAEHRAAAAEPRNDLVADEQNTMPVTDPTDPGPVTGRRYDYPAGSLNRFGNERRNGIRALELDLTLQESRADLCQFLRVFRERVAIQPGRIHVKATG